MKSFVFLCYLGLIVGICYLYREREEMLAKIQTAQAEIQEKEDQLAKLQDTEIQDQQRNAALEQKLKISEADLELARSMAGSPPSATPSSSQMTSPTPPPIQQSNSVPTTKVPDAFDLQQLADLTEQAKDLRAKAAAKQLELNRGDPTGHAIDKNGDVQFWLKKAAEIDAQIAQLKAEDGIK